MMTLDEMAKRALEASLKKEKIFLAYPILLLTTLISVFVLAILDNAHDWVVFGAISVPVYLSIGLVGSLSVFIHRLYYHELKGETIDYKEIFKASMNRMWNGVFLALPLILTHVILWVFMGLFYLLQGVPFVGPIIAVLFSMLPFAFMMIMTILPLFAFFILFYGSTFFAFDLKVDLDNLKENPLTIAKHFAIGTVPLLLGGVVLGVIYWATMDLFGVTNNIVALSLQRLFLLAPFSFYLTPFVLFFFHFGLESYRHFYKKV
jgi:hypothetical protein